MKKQCVAAVFDARGCVRYAVDARIALFRLFYATLPYIVGFGIVNPELSIIPALSMLVRLIMQGAYRMRMMLELMRTIVIFFIFMAGFGWLEAAVFQVPLFGFFSPHDVMQKYIIFPKKMQK